jgi:hypothetical protein
MPNHESSMSSIPGTGRLSRFVEYSIDVDEISTPGTLLSKPSSRLSDVYTARSRRCGERRANASCCSARRARKASVPSRVHFEATFVWRRLVPIVWQSGLCCEEERNCFCGTSAPPSTAISREYARMMRYLLSVRPICFTYRVIAPSYHLGISCGNSGT